MGLRPARWPLALAARRRGTWPYPAFRRGGPGDTPPVVGLVAGGGPGAAPRRPGFRGGIPARGCPQAARHCGDSGSGVDGEPVVAALVEPAPRCRWRVLGVHRAVVRRRCGVYLVGGRLARRRRSRLDPVAAVLGVGPLLGSPGQTGAPDADARGPDRGGGGRERAGHADPVEPGGGGDLLVRRAAPRPRVLADRVCAVGGATGHADVSGGDLPRMLRLRRHRPDFPVPRPLPLAVPSGAAFPARPPAAARGCARHLALPTSCASHS